MRTADWPPVPPRGAIGPNGEITRRTVGALPAVAVAKATEERNTEEERPRSRLAETAWFFGALAPLGGLFTFLFVQGITIVIVRHLPGDVLWLSLGGGLGLPAIIFGFLALSHGPVRSGEIRGRIKAHFAIGFGMVGLLLAGASVLAGQGHLALDVRLMTLHRLREIAIATFDYAENHNNSLPPAEAFRPKDGRPGLSWRVALLPYLGQNGLYKQFNLDEPWDSPNNVRLLDKMPDVYRLPGQDKRSSQTHYQVFVGPKTPFERNVRVKLTQQADGFPDGTANTILVVIAKDPVPWTKPDDLVYDPDTPLPPLWNVRRFGSQGSYAGHVIMADGSVHSLRRETPEATIRALITRNGGEPVVFPD
jgi:hypothetical protein